jgi:hypothetical protein
MPRFEGFCGGSYAGRASQADAERSINWYPERIEVPGGRGKTDYVLLSKPGLSLFATLPGVQSVLALYQVNGRVFAIGGGYLWEVSANGTATQRGRVGNPGSLVLYGAPQMIANQQQLLVALGGNAYVLDLGSNVFAAVTSPGWIVGACQPIFVDGYFICRVPNTQEFIISNLNDATTWQSIAFGDAEGQAGNVQAQIPDHRLIWFLCTDHSEAYYDSGAANFPWTRLDGAFMAQGCGATSSVFPADNTFFWLSAATNQGYGMAWRASGYTPLRVSTFAIENLMQSFPQIADASGYSYQENGHTFCRWDFPSATSISGVPNGGQTLVFDPAVGLWHERTFYNADTGQHYADLARSHTMLGTQHLVGDYSSGKIYVQSMNYATDNGAPIFRRRVCPDIADGGKRRFYGQMRFQTQVGIGLDGVAGPGTDPQLLLRVSNDGGKTWGQERSRSLGKIGAFNTLVRFNRMGSSYNRTFEITCSDPVQVALVSCDLD